MAPIGSIFCSNSDKLQEETFKEGAKMKIYPLDPEIRKIWKIYPVRIPGGSTCHSCHEETVLVQSMDGGFVTRNCPLCNKEATLPEHIFKQLNLWVACPKCKKRMASQKLPDGNYGYTCSFCNIAIPLFALLPKYTDL
jgi:hypothetical protein